MDALTKQLPIDFDEQELVIRLHAGDQRALETLHVRYWQVLVSSAIRYVHDADVACDVVQDVFADLWARRATWHPSGRIAQYLFAAVRNRAISVVRHLQVVADWEQQAATTDISTLSPPPSAADESLEAAELDALLRSRLKALPERCRETYLLYRSGDLTLAEVAQVMGVSTETAKTQIKRAMAALRETVRRYRT